MVARRGPSSAKGSRVVFGLAAAGAFAYIVWAFAGGSPHMGSISGSAISRSLHTSSDACNDRHALWTPSIETEHLNPELAEFLKNVAINNEVLMAVSNINLAMPGGMLEVWMRNVKRAGVKNAFVLALDDETKENVEKFGFPVFRMHQEIPKAQRGNGSNHAVSAMKFRILREFLQLGYAVFLSDVDILTFKNPFGFLTRDSDVEGMSDGWDPPTAYGYDDVLDDQEMGWSRYAHSIRIFVFNSGLFYIRPTQASMDLIDKIIHRVETENGWDQAIFNECIFFPSHPGYKDPGVTRRVLALEDFMNSKFLFKFHRHDASYRTTTPVMLHVNYHSNKFERMIAAERRYVEGDMAALDDFPVGS